MRFLIEYKDFKNKETKNVSLNLLETFLNEHLIGKYHGQTFECILIRFIHNAPSTRKLKLKSLYKTIAEVELTMNFNASNKLNLEIFQEGLFKVEEAIKKVPFIERKQPLDYKEDELLNDYKKVLQFVPKTIEELKKYAKAEQEIKFYNQVKRTDCLIHGYSINPRPLTRNIIGIRIYNQFDKGTLAPFDYIYSEIFSNLLRKAKVLLPNYDEIYVNIAETLEQAKQEIALDAWHKYTYSTLDLSTYLSSDDTGKSKMLFRSVCDGLRLIADFDHLEKEKIEEVIHIIKNNGRDMELTYMSKQNKNYFVEIIYKVPNSHLDKAEYKLRVTDLKTGKSGIAHIDYIHTYWAPYSFGKIIIKKDEIIIKGRESLRAEISRKADKLPDMYIFKISDIF
ncbi:hypothetical protein DCC39_09455 [Pueribacillus theae]|uniref:Uncharacterized protein n=1 Tax=Pueribacillus theae TaxID=2171751 RepID=A0A2U1K101_9BACI|nr:hypothetical protein [Pueribacillus theae]PWA11190.1 hypothetical protein DCC39_09455 [Pueribacillus theae]